MLLTKIRTAFFAVRHPRNARRSRRAERATCRCPLETLSLYDGQHPASCAANHFTVKPFSLKPHQVEGVVMPAAGPTSPDLDIRWCDLTLPGGFLSVGRNWPGHCLLGTAMKYPDDPDYVGWHWWVSQYDLDLSSEGKQHELGDGVAETLEEAIRNMQEIVDEEIAQSALLERLRRVID